MYVRLYVRMNSKIHLSKKFDLFEGSSRGLEPYIVRLLATK